MIFIPYARSSGISYDEYTKVASAIFQKININIEGINEFSDVQNALKTAQTVFVGGGKLLFWSMSYTNKTQLIF